MFVRSCDACVCVCMCGSLCFVSMYSCVCYVWIDNCMYVFVRSCDACVCVCMCGSLCFVSMYSCVCLVCMYSCMCFVWIDDCMYVFFKKKQNFDVKATCVYVTYSVNACVYV